MAEISEPALMGLYLPATSIQGPVNSGDPWTFEAVGQNEFKTTITVHVSGTAVLQVNTDGKTWPTVSVANFMTQLGLPGQWIGIYQGRIDGGSEVEASVIGILVNSPALQ